MQKITLLTVGKLKESWAREAADMYVQRLRPSVSLTVMELGPSRGKDGPAQQAEESDRILKMLGSMQGEIWVLDETGKGMISKEFSKELEKAKDQGTHLVLVLGGAYGFTDAVRNKAQKLIRLSDMTFPHELCRVVLLEQLYRAFEIQKGSGYHH